MSNGLTPPLGDAKPPYKWNISILARALESKYQEEGLTEWWKTERERVTDRLTRLQNALQSRYSDPSILGVGGSGIVLKLIDRDLANQPVALKFPRPVAGQSEQLAALLSKEISSLATLRHTSIIRIHSKGTVAESIAPFPSFSYYVMDYVDGSPSAKFFRKAEVSEEQFISVLQSVVDALAYLHDRSTAHLDVKPDNILITVDGVPVIADLGTAKRMGPGLKTSVACTFSYAHPRLLELLAPDPSDQNRSRGELDPALIRPEWDLYSFGLTLLAWLGFENTGTPSHHAPSLSPYTRKYLLLMAARMLGRHARSWMSTRLRLDHTLLEDVAYSSFRQVLTDVRKLSGHYSVVDIIPELNVHHPSTLQIGSDTPATYSGRLKRLVEHPIIERLAGVNQLGVVSQVYLTSSHSRLEHSLGTYHNACKFVLSLYYDPFSPLFRQIFDADDIKAVLVAALLHDIGQYPLAHDLEELSVDLFSHVHIGQAILEACVDPAAITEGTTVSRGQLAELREILGLWDTSVERVLNILRAKPETEDGDFKDRLLHSIIDGPLDADKLDYLLRDSHQLNVPYAQGIDIDRILRSLTVIVTRSGSDVVTCVGVHEKAKVAAEFVAITRYALFSQVYWHHAVRAMKAMLTRAVLALLSELHKAGDDALENFRAEFSKTVWATPIKRRHSILGGARIEERSDLPRSREAVAEMDYFRSTLTASDLAVIEYLRLHLEKRGRPEANLLDDLAERKLFKRLFVFSRERSEQEWKHIVDAWEGVRPLERISMLQHLENAIVRECRQVLNRDGATQSSIQPDLITELGTHVDRGNPVILVDVPGARPGSSIPLYYIVEAQRRVLRKDDRAVGDAEVSQVWRQFGTELRERAGKVRIFAHPRFIDLIEACIPRKMFVEALDTAVKTATRRK